jgi:hypothetical protein
VTLGGARCRLLRRQARAVPLSVSAPPARAANGTGRAAAAQGPVFTYQPFVTAAGAPVPPGAVDEALKLPQLAARAESASAEAEQPISIRNGQLYGVDGQPLVLKGINWRADAPRRCPVPPRGSRVLAVALPGPQRAVITSWLCPCWRMGRAP